MAPVSVAPAPAQVATAQVATSAGSFDADDNDLSDNRVTHVSTVPQTITQVVSQPVVHVQKIKVRPQAIQVQPTVCTPHSSLALNAINL